MQNKANKNKEITEMKVELTELPEPVTIQDNEPEINKGNINNDSEQESELEVEQGQNKEPQQLSEDKIIELKNMRYEHMFKFIWFFWAMLSVGVAFFLVFDIHENPTISTIGPMITSIALTLLFITAKYLIYEKDIFIFNKELYKDSEQSINNAEKLYIAIGILMKLFFNKIIPTYLLLLALCSSANFNIYKIVKTEVLPYITCISGVLSIIFWSFELIEEIKLKGSNKPLKNPMNQTHLAVANHILIFIFLFSFCIILQNNLLANNITL